MTQPWLMTIDPPGHVLDVRHVVGGQEDGRALRLVEVDEQLAEAPFGQQVETDRRLVEEEDLGLVQEARGQLAAHPLPERQVAHRHVEAVRGVEQLGQLGDATLLDRRATRP